jgi:hypothetical protein
MRFLALDEPVGRAVVAPTPTTNAAKVIQNLLVHIPGEASGFYLMALDLIKDTQGKIVPLHSIYLGAMAFVLLVVVRWLAGASWGVHLTTIGAFLLWMAVLDNGFLHLNGWHFPGQFGLVVALFYSTLITLLGSAGKIK